MICCCSLAGTASCQRCPNNPAPVQMPYYPCWPGSGGWVKPHDQRGKMSVEEFTDEMKKLIEEYKSGGQ